MSAPPEPIPVTLLTGFLGSGKTTLLRKLLALPAFADTVVLVNEIGAAAIVDQQLVSELTTEALALGNGCACCTVRSELVGVLRRLLFERGRGSTPRFRRVVIETSGLADPAPVAQTLLHDPWLTRQYRIDGIVTVVDATLGMRTLDRHPESVRQVVFADAVVLAKTDVAASVWVEALATRVGVLNPAALQLRLGLDAPAPGGLATLGCSAAMKPDGAARWVAADRYASPPLGRLPPARPHGARALVLPLEDSVAPQALTEALGALAARHGEAVLRVKGLVRLAPDGRWAAVHAVQHRVFPLVMLATGAACPAAQLVLIVRDVPADELVAMLAARLPVGAAVREQILDAA